MRTALSIYGLVPWSVIKLEALSFPPKRQFSELCVLSWFRPASYVAPIYIYCSYSKQLPFVIHKSYLLPSYLCLFPFLFETPVQAQLLVKPLQAAIPSVAVPFSLRSLKSHWDGVWTVLFHRGVEYFSRLFISMCLAPDWGSYLKSSVRSASVSLATPWRIAVICLLLAQERYECSISENKLVQAWFEAVLHSCYFVVFAALELFNTPCSIK